MKEGKNNVSLNLNLLNEKTSFEKLEETLKVSIFGVLYVLLKNQDFSVWAEIIFVILQLLQFMAFPFRLFFDNVWKQQDSFSQVSNFLQYFQIVVFFQDNADMYIIAFYICICLIILVIINIVYVSISFSKNKFNVMWPLRVLRSMISFLVTVLFLPIFELFISIFNCVNETTIVSPATTTTAALRLLQTTTTTTTTTTAAAATVKKVNLFSPTMECWVGSYYAHVVFSIVVSIAFILICVVIQMTYYETKSSTHNQSAKNSSKSDVFMLLCKILTVLLFGFFGQNSSEWILIILMFFLSGFMFFSYYEERPYYSDQIMKVYLVCTGIYFWNCTVLLIGKILESSNFDGCLPLFFLGIPIVLAIILTNYDNKLAILLTNMNKFQKGERVVQQINYFLELVDKKDYDRNSKVILKGYIYLFEETCTFSECALKKYNYSLENNLDIVAFLYQHAESLYQSGISKFPNSTQLRISFAFFLLERVNKKQQANLELLNTEKYNPKFEEQFIIYRYKKIIEEQSSEVSDSEDNLDVVSNITYKNHFNQFKNCIAKVASLYMDFWSLLLNPNQDNNEDLAKLNDYGSKINVLVEEINVHFDKMQKLKHNDQDVMRYYSDFLYDILNDKEKANHFKSKLNEIEGSKQNYDDINLMNIDLNAIQSTDEYQYLVVSALPEKFGLVTSVSLGICSMFGYTRTELIGKSIDFVMPEIFHKGHKNVLQEKINEYKKLAMNIQSLKNYKPSFRDINSFGKNKSRYLVPFNFKVTFVPNNEQNDSVFLGKISQELYNLGPNTNQQICYILTNNAFIVQNFTANSINILGMNSGAINNGNMEIIRFIKEFQEEFLKFNIDLEEKTPEQVLAIKKQIINTKFKAPMTIIWRKADEGGKDKMKSSNTTDLHGTDNLNVSSNSQLKETKIIKDNKFLFQGASEEILILTIQEVTMLGKLEGYVFKFEVSTPVTKDPDLKASSLGVTKEPITTPTPDSGLPVLNVNKEITNQLSGMKKTPGNEKKESGITMLSDFDPSLKIDKGFIPENNFNFHLDPKKLSYLVNPKNLNELRDAIKEEAMKKVNLVNHDGSVSESGSDSSYTSHSGSYDSNMYSSEGESESESHRSGKKQQNDDFYHINFNNIKLLIYDVKKECLVEVMDWEKLSYVDQRKNEDPKKKDNAEKNEGSGGTKESTDGGDEEIIDNQGKEGILIKQIEYALSKEENQPTITKMKWISFFVFFIYIGLASVFLAFFINAMSWVIENVTLIYNSYDLIENTIYGIFHTRELVLLNNPKYTNIYQTKPEYIKNNTDMILDLFASSHDLLTNLITTFLGFTTDNDYTLNNKTIYTTILQDDLSIKTFNLTLSSSFIETNTALYHIAHLSLAELIGTNKDVFFYIYNSINDVSLELFGHALIYIQELGFNSADFQLQFLLIFIGATVFGVMSYFIISVAYMAVEKRKESYLEVFFEIGGAVIKNSLEKCENFSKKIQTDAQGDNTSNIDDGEFIQENQQKTASPSVKKTSGGKNKRRTNNSREARVIKIKLALGIALFSLFFFLVYFMYNLYLQTVITYSEILKNTCLEQSEFLMLFNTLREYFFDRTSFVENEVVNDYIEVELSNIYSHKLERETTTSNYLDSFPTDYATLYTSIINSNICPYSTDFFDTYLKDVGCTKFVSNSSSYGLNILLTNYVEEMRYAKYKFDLMLLNSAQYKNFTYNNTLHNHALDPTVGDYDYNQNDPFEIFNDASHKNLVILNRFLLRPAYIALKTQLKTSIDASMSTFQTIYIVIISIFLSFMVVIYLFIWRPFENGLNQTIYKTKNMLSIIPKEVLASLSNIHKLLDIGQNFSKNKRMTK